MRPTFALVRAGDGERNGSQRFDEREVAMLALPVAAAVRPDLVDIRSGVRHLSAFNLDETCQIIGADVIGTGDPAIVDF